MSHLRRPAVTGVEPVQVTLKLQPDLPSLRSPALKASVEQAIDAGHERFGMRLLRYSLDKDGLSLVVTAPNRRALSRGIQGISVRIARAVNRKLERKGRLFADRYEAELVGRAPRASPARAVKKAKAATTTTRAAATKSKPPARKKAKRTTKPKPRAI
ncbi:MAG: hypothetical protein RL685_1985 [Pseudomonadota bacterium]